MQNQFYQLLELQIKKEEITMPELEQIIQNSKEPEVTRAVFNEIQKIGEDTKKGQEELRKGYEQLKTTMDQDLSDAAIQRKFQKQAEDLVTRQEKLDEIIQKQSQDFTKRMDDLEVAFKRPGAVGPDDQNLSKEAKAYMHMLMATKGGSRIEPTEADIAALNYGDFSKAFTKYARVGTDRLDDIARKAMIAGSDPDGGYVVPVAMASSILTRQFEMDPIRSLASIETISTGAIEWPIDWDEMGDAEWEGETVSAGEKKTADLGKKRIDVYALGAKVRASQTLIEDASINIEQWISRKAADKFARQEGAAFVSGNGISKPRGFLTYADYTTAGTDEYGKIEQIHMGDAAAITADGFIKIKFSMIEPFISRGTWLLNRSTVKDTLLLKDGNGQYIWSPGLQRDSYSTILGLPVRMSTSMPAVAASAMSVVLADWKEAYMIVDRLGITMLRDPYTSQPFILFRFRKRVGGDVVNYQAIKIGTIEA